MIDTFRRMGVVAVALSLMVCASPVRAQESPGATVPRDETPAGTSEPATLRTDERHTTGTVNSVGRGSIVVRTDTGQFMVFSVNRALVGFPPVDPGARVRVTTAAGDDDPAPMVLAIEQLPARQGLATQTSTRLPEDIQRITSQIERQAKRFRAGVSAGAVLDPEMLSVDAFATLTPWARPRLAVRPSMEFAFGEITTLLGWNIDVLYSLPGIRPLARWAPYVGGGPNFSFSHRGIDEDEFLADPPFTRDDNGRFDFSQWDWNNGLNFIVGARNPNGTFFELKATAYGTADIRMLGGFEF